ncbi:amidohydrolase [Clostridium aceticum]|uniref:Amidohydrolase n=1 Tax=Clostridium aceticum TaxID=84022 RepID=A0A0D8IAP8_9CLOT|nr:amidohydrolase family protein [Clostridium aceticum]AKL96483.1 amidohydrolase [Clostridium aceticum]KJF27345.1 hypothetical protein TZ02_08390 [Clostridium aceticum]
MSTIVLKNSFVVDPSNGVKGYKDLEITNGVISQIANSINTRHAQKVYDMKGKTCIPGIIDTHVHLTLDGSNVGYTMLAKAGVTSALDMYGPVDKICDNIDTYGSGINVACLTAPFKNTNSLSYQKFDESTIRQFVNEQLSKGAIGIKLIGGHYPMDTDLTRDFIRIANEQNAYVAFHVGTTSNGSNIDGLREAIEISKGYNLHIAHINSYCREEVYDSLTEIKLAIDLLKNNRNIISESYLSLYNGTSGRCKDGRPLSQVTAKCLNLNNYQNSEEGLKKAILEGVALVIANVGDEKVYIKNSKEALAYYKEQNGNVYVSFSINKSEAAYMLATAKDDHGNFVVNAISTDGGEIPRNVIIEKGLQLVKFGALTLEEFVIKTSLNPAKMLGLNRKGSFKIGNDADITVIDLEREVPVMSMVMGEVIMYEGLVVGKGGRIITTSKGVDYIKSKKLEPYTVNIADALLYKQ